MNPNDHQVGVGATEELSLRVSVAALVSVLFADPEDGRTMLALERTATLREIEGRPEVTVTAKPFGGVVRLIDPQALAGLIGQFHYDSERSRREGDFRIRIPPAAWEKVKEICRDHLSGKEEGLLDSSPERELAEEFEDALNVKLTPHQYRLKARGATVQDLPVETHNVRAEGVPTVRIYYIFEAWIEPPEIVALMLDNSRRYSDEDLQKAAWNDAGRGGRGRANAILALGFDDLKDVYRSIGPDVRGGPFEVLGHRLERSVLAILNEVDQHECRRQIGQTPRR